MKASNLFLIILLFSTSLKAQSTDFVELMTGERYKGKVEVQTPFLKKARVVVNDSTTILLEKVRSYQTEDGYFMRISSLEGSGFAKRVEEGNIDLYIKQQMNYGGGGHWIPGPNGTSTYMPGGGMSSSSVQYFSKNDGPVRKANARNLKVALADNSASMDYLKKRDGLTAVQVIGIIGGLAIGTASILSQSDKEVLNPTGIVVGLVVVTGSSWIPHFAKQDMVEKAIQEYNRPVLPTD